MLIYSRVSRNEKVEGEERSLSCLGLLHLLIAQISLDLELPMVCSLQEGLSLQISTRET